MNVPYGIVYLVTNTANGKEYVGQTIKTLIARKMGHLRDARTRSDRTPFSRAIRKYGAECFTWQMLMVCSSRADLDATERAYIGILGTKKPEGYNLTDGGKGIVGYSREGKPLSAEHKRKISEGLTGRTLSVEHTRKMSEALKGKQGQAHSAEAKRKIGEAFKGKPLSLEHRRKLSEALKGKPSSMKGRTHSAETKRKISETQKGRPCPARGRRKAQIGA